jgi:hypothetical protein
LLAAICSVAQAIDWSFDEKGIVNGIKQS